MASAKAQALAAIAAAGGEFEEWGSSTTLIGSAHIGEGRSWTATGSHTIAVNFHTDRPAGWRALLTDVRCGTEPCDLADCDVCDPTP